MIGIAVIECMRRTGVSIAAASYWDLAKDRIREIRESPMGGMGHACELETSLQLHFQPGLVAMELAECNLVDPMVSFGTTMSFKDLLDFGPITTGHDNAKTNPSGVRGDPTIATAAKGEQIVTAVLERMSQFIKEYRG